MFHDLLLWGMLLFTFVAKEKRYSFTKKISIAIVAAFLAITIQSVKASYRQKIWYEGYSGNKVTLFLSLAVQEWNTGSRITSYNVCYTKLLRKNKLERYKNAQELAWDNKRESLKQIWTELSTKNIRNQ